jgi:methionyl-tRNA formyltransferase
VRIVFAGTPEVALPSLEVLARSEHELVAVLTRPAAPRGRGRARHPSPVGERAAELGLEVLTPPRPAGEEFLARLAALAPDCCPVVAYGALLPQPALDVPTHGWVNLHFSLLPAWRGAAPVQHAILAGDAVTGATTFRLVAAMDAGPSYATVTEAIAGTDTAGDLLGRLAMSGAKLLAATLDGIAAGTLRPRPQPDHGISFAPKITVEDAGLRWSRPAVELDRVVRGCTPSPGAWTTFRGERLKITAATIDSGALAPGVLEVTKRSVRVGTATNPLRLLTVQASGKKPMDAADWARGVTISHAEVLGG